MFLLVSVALAAPAPLERVARDTVRAGPSSVAQTLPLGGPAGPDGLGPRGAVVQLRPVIDGIPVDRISTVRFGPDGKRRGTVDPELPARRVEGPAISSEQAIAAANRTVAGHTPRARLSWQVTDDVLRRVWTIELDGAPPGPVAPRVRIDAVSGGILSVDDAADAEVPLARVFPKNPLADPTPVEVALPLAELALADARVEVHQCRDLGVLVTQYDSDGNGFDVHVCTVVPADGPTDGNYLYDPVPYPLDPARDEDDFAGPQVYWNVHRGLDWFDAHGWVPLPAFDPRLLLTVNLRTSDLWSEATAGDPAGALLPYDNAYSTGGYFDFEEYWVPPELVFGQGAVTDYAYDASVVHHELGHFVVRSQAGPSYSDGNSYGPSWRANALNEGFADYFAAAIAEDSLVGAYIREGGIRDLAGDETCATDLVGQPHYDSLPFSQGLWALRASLPGTDRAILDAVVVDSLSIMGEQADFPDAAAVIETLVGEQLGAPAAEALAAIWDGRGIHDCPPVIGITAGDTPFVLFGMVGGSYWYSTVGPVPGTIQYRVEVPEGGARLTLSFDQAEYLGLDPYGRNAVQPLGVVGRAGDRITWAREDREVEFEFEGNTLILQVQEWVPDGETVAITVATEVIPSEVNPQYDIHHHETSWEVEAGGTYVFQLTNAFEREALARDLTLRVESLAAPEEVWEWVPAEDDGRDVEPSACGCGSTGGAGAFWTVGLVLLAWRQRRPVATTSR